MIRYIVIFLLLSTVFFTGCDDPVASTEGQETTSGQQRGDVRIIHSASSTDEIDITFRDLYEDNYYVVKYATTYGNQYGYYDFVAGDRDAKMYLTNTNIAVSAASFTVEENKKYTIIAYDYESTISPDLMVLNDTLAVPDSGYAYIRLVHLAGDAGALQITEKDNRIEIPVLEHLDHTAYLKVVAGSFHFSVEGMEDAIPDLDIDPVTFLSQNIYTIIFSGSVDNATPVAFNAKTYRETSL